MTALTYYGGSGDCWADEISFYTGGTELQVAGSNLLNNVNVWDWIPFANIGLPQGFLISSATIYWTATRDRSDACETKIGCEDADNPSTPTSGGDISGRTLTSNYTTASLEAYTTGNEYGYDVTDAVQEILNRAGWAYGNQLAILCDNKPGTGRRYIAAYENGTYARPRLVIEFANFRPRVMMF